MKASVASYIETLKRTINNATVRPRRGRGEFGVQRQLRNSCQQAGSRATRNVILQVDLGVARALREALPHHRWITGCGQFQEERDPTRVAKLGRGRIAMPWNGDDRNCVH